MRSDMFFKPKVANLHADCRQIAADFQIFMHVVVVQVLLVMFRTMTKMLCSVWVNKTFTGFTMGKQSVRCVSKKTKQICFCQNCIKFPPILIIFGRKMANDTNICEVHSLSISSNLRHHLTVLNANVPNCYITPNVVVCNKLLKT